MYVYVAISAHLVVWWTRLAAHGDAVYANVMRPLAANTVRRRRERLSSGSQGTTTRSFIEGVVGGGCATKRGCWWQACSGMFVAVVLQSLPMTGHRCNHR